MNPSKKNRQHTPAAPQADLTDTAERKSLWCDTLIPAIIFAFGIYLSVIFFGHQLVPNPDFPGFFNVGRTLWHGRLPGNFMRAPMVGLLQYPLSLIVPGASALTAGWLLNAILFPLNGLLLYTLCRRFLGRGALIVTLLVMINPWTLQSLIEPIAETPLLFFTLLSFYLMARRSRWAYAAAAAASMVRYECTALIAGAFVLDMIESRSARQRLVSLALSIAASIPFGLWMLGTALHWQADKGVHYLKLMENAGSTGLWQHMVLAWQVAVGYLIVPRGADSAWPAITGIVLSVLFLLGIVGVLRKRQWLIIPLLIFLVPYILVHANFPFALKRFYASVFWIVLLIAAVGMAELLFWSRRHIVATVLAILLGIAAAVALLRWAFFLGGHLEPLHRTCIDGATLPTVGIIVTVVLCLLGAWSGGLRRTFFAWSIAAILLIAGVIANQFTTAAVLGNGQTDAEFKMLADWYESHTDGQRLTTTMKKIMDILLPDAGGRFVHITHIGGDDLAGFIADCRARDITYVVWDSRKGLYPNDPYSKAYRLGRIAALAAARDVGPLQYNHHPGP